MSNNLVFRIADDLHESLPNLHTLMLANNNLLHLNDLLPLTSVKSLRRLVLLENNVTKQPNYRLFVAQHFPNLLALDFKKIKPKVILLHPVRLLLRCHALFVVGCSLLVIDWYVVTMYHDVSAALITTCSLFLFFWPMDMHLYVLIP